MQISTRIYKLGTHIDDMNVFETRQGKILQDLAS